MPTAALVSEAEYLATSFDGPDREYRDGVLVERNMPDIPHSRSQRKLIVFFAELESTVGTFAYPEARVQVEPHRYIVADVSVVLGGEVQDRILRTPPFLAIEIRSPGDRAIELDEKIQACFAFGVGFVWVVDPELRLGYIHTPDGLRQTCTVELWTRDPDIRLTLSRVF